MSRLQRIMAWGMFALVLMVLSGWLLADFLTPPAVGIRVHTLALQDAQTALDREIVPLVARHGGKTGAILVPDGVDAFAARALSARQAGRSLDLQYYIWHNDMAGYLLAHEVLAAAERGVRVRLLLDDMNDSGQDSKLLALDAHPDIEIRVYNPFRNRTSLWRVLEMIQRVHSVNHRMHNKAWIADGRVAVLGGRNIGEAYFDASTDTNFRDLDVVLFGPRVQQASRIFDAYWNSDAAVPISALTDIGRDRYAALTTQMQSEEQSPDARHYLSRVEQSRSVRGYLAKKLEPHWSDRIEVVSDPPLKWKGDEDRSNWLVTRVDKEIAATRHKALIISPYFVPGDNGTDKLIGLVHDRDAFVGVITNSLAANDVPAVHAGYSAYRGRLLKGGVKLYELRADPKGRDGNAGLFGSSGASLHTKAFVIDDKRGFIGSFNMDPRSANLNTEMGVFFEDRAMAAALHDEYLRLAGPKTSYWVLQNGQGDIRWLDRTTKPPTVKVKEPESTRLQRAKVTVLGWLPIESQL